MQKIKAKYHYESIKQNKYFMDYMNKYDRLKGVIYGQAIGDALGLGTEGMTDEDMAWK